MKDLHISTPGRICLFGEHQDYLGLPVIAAAISRRIHIEGRVTNTPSVHIQLPDIQSEESFPLVETVIYHKDRDYFKSVLNVLRREKGISFEKGIEAKVYGNIPINSGTSSSSALVVAWTHFLLKTANHPIDPVEIGQLAYLAEVEEFGEPGGCMDEYATSIGNIMYLETKPNILVEAYQASLGKFVLGDSLEPKDTIGILKHVKFGMLDAINKIKQVYPDFQLSKAPIESAEQYQSLLNPDEYALFYSNLSDRDILRTAKAMFEGKDTFNDVKLGQLLSAHQDNLRDAKRVSTPKINRMIEASLKAGALGGKINGSGGGGCMFAYAPTNTEAVVEAIEREGGKAYIIEVSEGSKEEI
ncbi:mevalonate kinase family protein [Flectobacillus rivi]|uniref:Galactokinase family protein n=1 Tax=Flectobacillus rivi TaxID=2984209 RepID=A0ABT6YWR2_9BACT|nr:galactokinase family protein [Flectobacillus rivi]MDI9873253.1 galactokinase family protein [Flectobacillus rivi]